MAEFTQALLQTVEVGQNVLFSDTTVKGDKNIRHRQGSGITTLRTGNNCCRALYFVFFSANVAISADGTAEEVSLAISIEGEPLNTSIMTVTPAAVGDFWNISTAAVVEVPCDCCVTVAVRNISGQPVDISGAKIIAYRLP